MERWLFLLLITVGACWSATCPEDCFCHHEEGMYKALCSSLPNTGSKVEVLQVLPDVSLQTMVPPPLELIDGQFNMARHLKYLNISHNSVFFIHKKTFYGARNLIQIDLSYNFIEELEPTVFQHLMKLTTLSLRGNPIQIVPEVPFLISNSIQNLDIGYCKLKSIPRGVFYGLKRLRYLSLDGNFLKTLKYNSLPKGLTYVNLAQNHIVNVPAEVLISLTNLRKIGLSGNPINCTCSLLNLQDWLSGRGRIFEDNVTCALPLEYSGINWSKVDEKKLCLAEAQRDEISHSTIYDKLFKNKLNRGYYFENEKSTSDENLQSDQPQSLHPDSQVEVMFTNDDTVAMGEMMRDEESQNNDGEKLLGGVTSTENMELPSITEVPENKEIELKNNNKQNQNHLKPEDNLNNKEETLNSEEINIQESINDIIESNNIAHEGKDVINKKHGNLSENLDGTTSGIETNVEFSDNFNNSSKSILESTIESKAEEENVEAGDNDLNQVKAVEFNELNEELNLESDDFKKEGLLISDKEHVPVLNASLEDSTVFPDLEETTADEELTTEEPLVVEIEKYDDHNDTHKLSSTVSSEISVSDSNTNDSNVQSSIISSEIGDLGSSTTEETFSPVPPETVTEIFNTEVNTNINATEVLKTDDTPETEQSKVKPSINSSGRQDPEDSKVKSEVAGAEVVMFCVAVLVTCLILYSIYKCRAPKKRQNKNLKDLESNRSTEMQDMASLLPKSPDNNEKKNNLKYNEKALASETMKLIPEQGETESQEFTPVPDPKTKLQQNNTINNNTSNPVTKTPSTKPKNQLNVNQPEPIQRAKAKVGIIPDSIPKTPIFLQKTYNGIKQV